MRTNDDRYLVVGAGNIGLATAAYLSNLGYEILIHTRRKTSIEETRSIHSTGPIAPGIHPIVACSTNLLKLATCNGGILPRKVIIGCRGNDVEDIAQRLAPFVHRDMSILMICSSRFAGLTFLKTLTKFGVANEDLPRIADFKTSPFVSRGDSDTTVNISAFKSTAPIAAQTPAATKLILKDFGKAFGNLNPIQSSLELNLRKCDDIIHIPLLMTGWINVENGEGHNIYRTATAKTTNLIVELDQERLSIANAMGFNLIDVCAGYQESYGTIGPSLLDHFQQVAAYTNATIQNAYHRFLFEDVPFGAVPLQTLARSTGVTTPVLDACITIAYKLLNLSPGWTVQTEDFDV
jgi:opine dehydrogenase